uniref:Uncharacterized protein n=1 Tax=viral metagenome TaxID=1070528 RepID=A0A6C0ERH7_9ZZZZ
METITYRNSKIPIQILPKGTLLFRKVINPEDDVKGVLLESGKRCITPNYNVFFHPNPFMGELALGGFIAEYGKSIYAYVLNHDVKILKLINPSKYTRRDKNKGTFIKRCSTVKKGCLPRSGRSWDPCMSDTLIEKYPNVVGMIAISMGDNAQYKASKKVTKKMKRFLNPVSDNRKLTGIPEIILHPLRQRPSDDLVSDSNVNHDTNYKVIQEFDVSDKAGMISFMEQHAIYDPNTSLYSYKS